MDIGEAVISNPAGNRSHPSSSPCDRVDVVCLQADREVAKRQVQVQGKRGGSEMRDETSDL